jgi:hypothetical protein
MGSLLGHLGTNWKVEKLFLPMRHSHLTIQTVVNVHKMLLLMTYQAPDSQTCPELPPCCQSLKRDMTVMEKQGRGVIIWRLRGGKILRRRQLWKVHQPQVTTLLPTFLGCPETSPGTSYVKPMHVGLSTYVCLRDGVHC